MHHTFKSLFIFSLLTLSFLAHAEFDEIELVELRQKLATNHRERDFKEAYHRLDFLVRTHPGNIQLNNFLCEFALLKANSENATLAFKLWELHLPSVSLEAIYATPLFSALRTNSFNSTPEKYPPLKNFIHKLIERAPHDPRIYELLSALSRDNHKRISAMVSDIYVEMMIKSTWSVNSQRRIDAFLSASSSNEARLSLLAKLSSSPHYPSSAMIEAALELADNTQSKPERALIYLNSVARKKPEALQPYQERIQGTLLSVLMESSEGDYALRAANLLTQASQWALDRASLQALVETLIDPQSPYGAQRAASHALLVWKREHSDFFESLYSTQVQERVEKHAAKAGHSRTTRNCRRLLAKK